MKWMWTKITQTESYNWVNQGWLHKSTSVNNRSVQRSLMTSYATSVCNQSTSHVFVQTAQAMLLENHVSSYEDMAWTGQVLQQSFNYDRWICKVEEWKYYLQVDEEWHRTPATRLSHLHLEVWPWETSQLERWPPQQCGEVWIASTRKYVAYTPLQSVNTAMLHKNPGNDPTSPENV